jgi:hypothetical protein
MSSNQCATRLHDIEVGHDLPTASFKLVGSGRIAVGIEDVVARTQLEATATEEKKLASLANVP